MTINNSNKDKKERKEEETGKRNKSETKTLIDK